MKNSVKSREKSGERWMEEGKLFQAKGNKKKGKQGMGQEKERELDDDEEIRPKSLFVTRRDFWLANLLLLLLLFLLAFSCLVG